MAAANPSGDQQTLHFDVTDAKLMKSAAKAAKDGPVTLTGNYSFAGIEDKYFVAAFLPDERHVRVNNEIPGRYRHDFQRYRGHPTRDQGSCRSRAWRWAAARQPVLAFRRPQGFDLLRTVNPKLEQVVDFGWLSMLAKPLFLIVNWVNDQR